MPTAAQWAKLNSDKSNPYGLGNSNSTLSKAVSATQANAASSSSFNTPRMTNVDVSGMTKENDGGYHGVLSAQQVAELQNSNFMGNRYRADSSGFYSTNPGNSNAARYSSDGRPVATLGFHDQPSGMSYSGYGTPEQFSQVMGTMGNPSATTAWYKNMVNSGQLGKPLSAGQAMAATAQPQPTMSTTQAIPTPMQTGVMKPVSAAQALQGSGVRWDPNASFQDRLSHFGSNRSDAENEILAVKQMYEAEKAAGASQDRLNQISQWAGQVRSTSGISVDDARYGNSNNISAQNQAASTNQMIDKNAVSDPTTDPNATPTGTPPAGTTTPGAGGVPVPGGGVAPPMTPEQIAAEAAARIQRMTTERTRVADQTKQGLQTSYGRLQDLTKDNRSLEDVRNQQLLSPFSGKSDYALGQIERERAITDRQASQDLQTRLANIDVSMQDYLNQTPEQQQEIMNQLTRQERDYAAQVGQLTGNYNGQRTVQGKQLDLQSQNQQFNQQQAIKQQHLDLANTLTQTFNKLVYPTDDPMLSYAQVADIPTAAAQKLAMDAANMSFDNAIKKALAENTINQTQASILHQAQQISISQQNANTSAGSAGNTAYNQNQQRLIEIWKTQGSAPDGINGVAAGTPYTGLGTSSGNKNNLESTYISNIEQMTPSMRTDFFKNEKAAIIKDVGITGYNQMYNTYFNQDGSSK